MMARLVTRRLLLAFLPFGGLVARSRHAWSAEATLAELERRHGGRLGVFARDTGSNQFLAYRPEERFTLCSTFKMLLAAQILARIDAHQEDPARLVHFNAQDLALAGYPDFACPVTAANVKAGALSVRTLCEAMVEVSDNLAAILLMRSTGGPAALTRFIRSYGDLVTRSDRYEPASNTYDGIHDTTTPRAIVHSVETILLGKLLTAQSRQLIESWMIASKPGARRLRASFPHNWVAGDRAGTYGPDETNDYALVRPPGRAPLIVAAYYDAPVLDLDAREAVIREVGAVFVRWVDS